MERTLTSETPEKVGHEVMVSGWVDSKRDHGKITFVDVRDRAGIIQVVGGEELKGLTPESVVSITGVVRERPENLHNDKIATGSVELVAKTVLIHSKAATLPFPIDTDGHDIAEETRLKYRYLDLRRKRMATIIRTKSQATLLIRNWLAERGFVEIDTPILTKTTPEGARDFIVPARLQPGNFYALPQSPQQYKQLLMVAGFERYFQFARCFRDEDPRADRAYGEFTQLDMELSFVTQNDILELIEQMFTHLVSELFPGKHIAQTPWPRISHKEAKEKYGSDKPDLRRDKSDADELAFGWVIDFPLFTEQSADDFYFGSGQAKFAPSHHMFTAPHPDDIPLLQTDPLKVRGLQHDLVLNGFEVGGGSIRIHQRDVQEKVFDLIGFTNEQKQQFDHMLTAFTFGVPPHGGIAPGLDRFLMAVYGEPSIREVIAFPTSASGHTAVVDAPSRASTEQLEELGIEIKGAGSVYERLMHLLRVQKIAHEHYEHEPVTTSEEAAKVRTGETMHQGAKALILVSEQGHHLLVVPGDMKADLKALKTFLKVKKLEMEKREKILELAGVEVGGVPPFGSLMGMTTVVDPRLSDNQEIVFNAGRRDRSVKMAYRDFLAIEKPVLLH